MQIPVPVYQHTHYSANFELINYKTTIRYREILEEILNINDLSCRGYDSQLDS